MSGESSHCMHGDLNFLGSAHASEAGFQRLDGQQRERAAKTTNGRGIIVDPTSFPGPLVLPGDELALDPEYPPQRLRLFINDKDRNRVSSEMKTIYVVAPPEIAKNVGSMSSWSHPGKQDKNIIFSSPKAQDIVDYLSAFYHGLPVKLLPSSTLTFTSWETSTSTTKRTKPKSVDSSNIALRTATELIRIRTRQTPSSIFTHQLNLDDLLDVALSILPHDAYALLMLVEHDIFENDDDDFTCGRAYGGSRVAVISTARYDPNLDGRQNVDREHSWPASHCEKYVQACCQESSAPASRPRKKLKKRNGASSEPELLPFPANPGSGLGRLSPMRAAVTMYTSLLNDSNSSPRALAAQLSGLWLARVCRTASHELGHCFGIDHCVFYACVMQGTASLAEDARQPMYLCPVDEAKLMKATGVDVEDRYCALRAYCEGFVGVPLFAAFGAWLTVRLSEVKDLSH